MRVAFVVQRYGMEVTGGAELLCRWVAEHLAPYGDIHVLTTCAQDYLLWGNSYDPGEELLNGVHVHRFLVDYPRDLDAFGSLTGRLLTKPHTHLDELEWMRMQGPVSTALLDYIQRHTADYNAFIFITYYYSTSYYGLQIIPDKAVLVPAAHDEPILHLPLFRSTFNLPRHIVYLTHAEKHLVQRVLGNDTIPSSVIGTGINIPDDIDADRFRRKYAIDGDFILYIGRIDANKGVLELTEFFLAYKQRSVDQNLKLVLIGRGHAVIPEDPDILSLGFVSEQDKFDALQAATLLVMPSPYESLSMVVLEAWLMQKPVFVNGNCAVLRDQCDRSNGGLYYRNCAEFIITLRSLLENPALCEKLGEQGHAYAREYYNWPTIVKKYLRAIAQVITGTGV